VTYKLFQNKPDRLEVKPDWLERVRYYTQYDNGISTLEIHFLFFTPHGGAEKSRMNFVKVLIPLKRGD
jgi:hypothetical protein